MVRSNWIQCTTGTLCTNVLFYPTLTSGNILLKYEIIPIFKKIIFI